MTNPAPDPYGDLFIYYLEGCLKSGNSITDRSFIGNWEEDGYSFIDIGTGTGLLAIAAVKLGCKRALAVDLNHLAVKTAGENIRLNGLEKRVLAIQGSADNYVDLPSDLVISNIHYDVMKRLFRSDRLLPTQYVILSGLLRSQAAKVEDLLEQVSIRVLKKWDSEGTWYSYLGKVSC